MRDEVDGSWFYNDLIRLFEKHYEEEHLEDILIILKREMAERTYDTVKQMPCTSSTFTKKLYMNELFKDTLQEQ
mgnify:CR=1 FL=1